MSKQVSKHPDFPIALAGTSAETLMWAHPHEVEHAAQDQLRNISKLPWVHGVRVMPDVHLGKGATVGSVVAMQQAVSPSAVGVDIGCGMAAVKTNLTMDDLPDDLHSLRIAIEKTIPVGFNSHDSAPNVRKLGLDQGWNNFWTNFRSLTDKVQDRETRAMQQMGTMGGGNHFLELITTDDGAIWFMVHSGSRNIGKEIAEAHITQAKGLEHNLDLPDRDLAVFLSGTPQMDAYLRDLYWAQDYAKRNRAVMLGLLKQTVTSHFADLGFDMSWGQEVSCHHNYVSEERYDDTDLIITRKGAIKAGSGDYGLIPGSMGTGSFLVKGLGNEQSYCSASHGAGRKMSRSKAKKTYTVADLEAQTAGVECRKDQGVVDEIPGAYKDLEAVIEAQVDLVEVVERFTTLLCVKG